MSLAYPRLHVNGKSVCNESTGNLAFCQRQRDVIAVMARQSAYGEKGSLAPGGCGRSEGRGGDVGLPTRPPSRATSLPQNKHHWSLKA